MSAKSKSAREFTHSQVAAFRMAAHHLHDSPGDSVEAICGAISGVQAQVMSCAELQFWARNHAITRAQISRGLYDDRSLAKTTLMRQTLHIIPACDFPLFISALEPTLLAQVHRIAGKLGVTADDFTRLNAQVLEVLRDGPLTQPEIRKRVQPRASKRMKAWMSRVWSILRTPVAQGLICYGPARGAQITFTRTDKWLRGRLKRMDARTAQQTLLMRYLAAYGPGTPRDFAKWSGIRMSEIKEAWGAVKDQLVEVILEGEAAWLPRKSLKDLRAARFSDSVVRLLPSFDPFLLAHAAKDHLVHPAHYKRVYGKQWWISPVVLIDGRVAGIWSHTRKSGNLRIEIEPFEKFSKKIRVLIEEESASMARFLDSSLELKFSGD
ncbi:MAG TPA: winged helix DNA-binding domain-containing protein [Candidatus Acidoferrum sp.]|nr:winged helix DNA-binding domain-containing protein [Candidatus Acidoferrum sp.]